MAKNNMVEQRKVYIRHLANSIRFSLEEIEKTVNQSPEEFHDRMCSNSRIGFEVGSYYNGDGPKEQLEGGKAVGDSNNNTQP